ncbi:DUF1708-domain-containing protein [Aureobasidium subglaciale]|nr:DUF1708-domain-containing protein [Aureobasidium subglaciale]KAI5213857.1 DUF1708-domain-containing protein [Aureobasidium subglaciale]KAI5215838.1 DUF1708-domain-containing protein [Aureobasidium subglaciale]KAI5253918.1 DUF1708-domain-containing protein [Aureobasidium subglaciale]
MAFLSKVFKSKDAKAGAKHKVEQVDSSQGHMPLAKPRFVSTWNSTVIDPEDVEELIQVCTLILKSRAEALDTPFLLLPFRPDTNTVAAKTFINNFFKGNRDGTRNYNGSSLRRELVLTDPAILCSVLKWCWARIPGGVVSWPVYHGFTLGERGLYDPPEEMLRILTTAIDSNMARNAFHTFIPLGVDSDARKTIIYSFFDLLTAIAAHGKTNGFGGMQLSRMAGWWAFEQPHNPKGFEVAYRTWLMSADASSHLFFGYLRSLNPEALDGFTGINGLPRSIQALLAQTEYPPELPALMQKQTPKVVMLVDVVSPGPFALLRRASNFEYRDEDLQMFSEYSDPSEALTEECRRVLQCITAANQSIAVRSQSNMSIGLDSLKHKPDESWSHFQDFGFSSIEDDGISPSLEPRSSGLRSTPRSRANDGGRPTTPSWADFLNSGFIDEGTNVKPTPIRALMPPEKMLPPINSGPPKSSNGYQEEDVNPGELASITKFDLDDCFWWVWMMSLATEETAARKAAFGRCALVETGILQGRWILLEEQIQSAAPEPEEGAYIAEKKSRFGFSRRGKQSRRKSATLPLKGHDSPMSQQRDISTTPNQSSMSPDQQARIRAAAATLVRQHVKADGTPNGQRRGRHDDASSMKTNSVMTLGLTSEAAPAMKWAHSFDKEATRKQYLGDNFAGKGEPVELHVPDNASVDAAALTEAQGSNKPLPAPRARTRSPSVVERQAPKTPDQPNASTETIPAPQTSTNNAEPQSLSASIISEKPVIHDATEMPTMPSIASKVTQVGRKPVPDRTNNVHNHPAFRPSAETQRPANTELTGVKAARQAWEAKANKFSPEIMAHENKRPNGFKRMFSRGHRNDDGKRDFTGQQPSASMTSLAPPSETSLGRKLSLLRKKSNTPTSPTQPAAPITEPLFPRRAVADSLVAPPSEQSPPAVSSLEPTFSQQHMEVDDNLVSPMHSEHMSNADEGFQRFDQGPLSDAPAWTPRESVDSHLTQEEAHKADLEAGHLNAPGAFPETPMETPMSENGNGQLGSDSVYETAQPVANGYDRWAQIRKNAAERVERGPRVSEDQISRRPSHITTNTEDEGDTSGEETIDDRVARIKARVAHLTGNLEQGPTSNPRP